MGLPAANHAADHAVVKPVQTVDLAHDGSRKSRPIEEPGIGLVIRAEGCGCFIYFEKHEQPINRLAAAKRRLL